MAAIHGVGNMIIPAVVDLAVVVEADKCNTSMEAKEEVEVDGNMDNKCNSSVQVVAWVA